MPANLRIAQLDSGAIFKRSIFKIVIAAIISCIFSVPLAGFLSPSDVHAESDDVTSVIYLTGIGCPHCANVDPILLSEWTSKFPGLIVVEYEIYQRKENAVLMDLYNDNYNSGWGIPLVIFDSSTSIGGDGPILKSFESALQDHRENPLPLHDGSTKDFSDLDINSLPFFPNIWAKNKVAVKTSYVASDADSEKHGTTVKKFLTSEDLQFLAEEEALEFSKTKQVQLSGQSIEFDNSAKIGAWIILWNGTPEIKLEPDTQQSDPDVLGEESTSASDDPTSNITLAKTISLAAVDAINPCALAVLTMILITIITYNPKNRKNILLTGLAFASAVLIMYLLYGFLIIKFFQVIQAVTSVRLILYKVLAVAAIILGILEIKDFFSYKAGSVGTEMPLFLRPKVKKIISGVTSPKGAFGVGLIVTIFLLPCTIGPYVILGGMLSVNEILSALPHLLLYNIIFILPMIGITVAVYIGVGKVEDISKWKDENIRKLHLVAGIIISLLGVAMLLGWV